MKIPAAALLILLCLAATARAESTVPATKTDTAPAREAPLRADMGLAKAEGQLAEGKYMQALETLGGVLERRPADADALAYSGFAWKSLGDTQRAAEYFDRAIKYDPQHLGANTYRAELFLEAGEFPRAMEQLQAIRVICAGTNCGELDRLQAELNAHRSGAARKEAPAADAGTDVNR